MDTPTAVLLDIDGTLVDSTYHHAIAWQRAFDRQDVPLPLWRIHRAVGMGGERLVAEVAGDAVERACGDDLRTAWREEYVELKAEVVPLPGAAELIRSLTTAGHRVALASSGDPQFAREAVAMLGVGSHVEVLTTAADVGNSKPDPDLVTKTLSRLSGVERAVFVGDTPYDVKAAERAGLRCLTVRSGGFHDAELQGAGAALVVDGPGELVGLDWEQHFSAPGRRSG